MTIQGIGKDFTDTELNSAKRKIENNAFDKVLKGAISKTSEKELREVCNQFEQLFLQMMYKQMKASVPRSDFLSGGRAGEIFQSMLDEKLMENASKRGSVGIADSLYRQMSND